MLKQKLEIKFKSVGQNVIIIDTEGVKHSARFIKKANRTAIKESVELYNKRNSIKRQKEIIKQIATQKEETKKPSTKVIKAKVKEAVTKRPAKATKAMVKKTTAAKAKSVKKTSAKQKAKIGGRKEY